MIWELIGLSLSLAGTIFIAVSVIPGVVGYMKKGKKYSLVVYGKWRFIVGIVCVAIGFAFQIIGVILTNLQKSPH